MNNKYNLSACIIAALCLTLSQGLRAADDKDTTDTKYRNRSAASTTTSTTAEPAKVNKASGLIGMQVRNQNDEKLGTIQDLVVDLQTGKIAYAVLDGGGILTDKYFAVPLTAFTPSADRKHLILHADKAKMQAARGFDKDHWPPIGSPDWGAEPFWEDPSGATRQYDRSAPNQPNVPRSNRQ